MALDWELKELDDFLGSAHVFSSAVSDVIEERLLAEVSGGLLTASQLKLLKLVAMADSHTIGDVAAFLGVSNAAASKAVDRLVRRNLLRRREDKKDRLSAGIVDHSSKPEELCLKCGIYFRERCLVRQLIKRNCFYQRHKQGLNGRRNGED